jgi:hypothetical protein
MVVQGGCSLGTLKVEFTSPTNPCQGEKSLFSQLPDQPFLYFPFVKGNRPGWAGRFFRHRRQRRKAIPVSPPKTTRCSNRRCACRLPQRRLKRRPSRTTLSRREKAKPLRPPREGRPRSAGRLTEPLRELTRPTSAGILPELKCLWHAVAPVAQGIEHRFPRKLGSAAGNPTLNVT